MGSQIDLTIALVSIALFTVAIIGFSINFANDNSSNINIADDNELSTLNTKMKSGVSTFSTQSESTYSSIASTTIEPGSESPQSSAPFTVTATNVVGVVNNIFIIGYRKIFGSNNGFGIFLTALISVITFLIGMYIYKTLRGQPD